MKITRIPHIVSRVAVLLGLLCSQTPTSYGNDNYTWARTDCMDQFKVASNLQTAVIAGQSEDDIAAGALLKVLNVLGVEGIGLVKSFHLTELQEPGMLSRLAALKQRMKAKNIDFKNLALSFSPSFLLKHEDAIARIALAADGEELNAFDAFNHFSYLMDADFIVMLTEILKGSPHRALQAAHIDAINAYPELFLEIAKIVRNNFKNISPLLSLDFMKLHGEAVLHLVRTHPLSAAGLLKAFHEHAFSIAIDSRSILREIEDLTHRGASDFVAIVPMDLWAKPEVLAAAAFYKDDAAHMYHLTFREAVFRSKPFDWLTAHQNSLFQLNRSLFGIVHFSRFVRGGRIIDFPTLENNLKNLDPAYDAHKKIAVHLFAEDDWNSAIHARVDAQTNELTKRYKVFAIEFGDKSVVTEHLQRISSLSGQHQKPLKPIDLLIINTHANSHILAANHNHAHQEVQDAGEKTLTYSHVTIKDKELLREWALYLGGANPTVLLGGCQTANMRPSGQPIAHVFAAILRGIRVIGARDLSFGWNVTLGFGDRYDCFDFQGVSYDEIIL